MQAAETACKLMPVAANLGDKAKKLSLLEPRADTTAEATWYTPVVRNNIKKKWSERGDTKVIQIPKSQLDTDKHC